MLLDYVQVQNRTFCLPVGIMDCVGQDPSPVKIIKGRFSTAATAAIVVDDPQTTWYFVCNNSILDCTCTVPSTTVWQ